MFLSCRHRRFPLTESRGVAKWANVGQEQYLAGALVPGGTELCGIFGVSGKQFPLKGIRGNEILVPNWYSGDRWIFGFEVLAQTKRAAGIWMSNAGLHPIVWTRVLEESTMRISSAQCLVALLAASSAGDNLWPPVNPQQTSAVPPDSSLPRYSIRR
jgi:hypothetical protein